MFKNMAITICLVDLDRIKKDFVFFDRIPAEYKTTIDFDTYRNLQAVYMRLSYGWLNWRGILGSQVS